MVPIKAMMDAFFDLPWTVGGIIFTSVCIFFSLLGLWVVQNTTTAKTRKSNHDVAGFTFGIVGVVYAVLLGFTVVNVNDRFNEIQMNLVQESAVMLQLYRDAEGLPAENRIAIREQIKKYALLVYSEEIRDLIAGKESAKPYDHLMELWKQYYKVQAKTETEKVWFTESVARMNQLADYRVLRLFNSTQSLGDMMWALLVLGALITVFFMYFFFVEKFLVHALLTAFLTGTIAFMLFLILSLDTAYSGYVRIDTSEIGKTIERFETI